MPPRARILLTTCVWGPWHLDIMERVMLPTLLSPGNLPALTRRADATYGIATTPADRERIMAWPIYRYLEETLPIEFFTERNDPDISYHVEWYHEASTMARAARAFAMFAPPDVAWSDGTLSHAIDAIDSGKLASAMPYLRVVSETALAEIAAREQAGRPLTIAPGELVRLAVRHLHPLSAAALANGRHGRPSLEVLWRVPGEGLLLRHMARELFAFDPSRVKLTHLWYAGDDCRLQDLHVVTDSEDMFMLSFAPLLKDIPIYIPDHPVAPMDLARQSLHPLNDTSLTSEFARHRVRLHYGEIDDALWRRVERRSDAFLKQAIVMREALRIWSAFQGHGCVRSSRLISVALQSTRLARRWPCDGPVTAFVPNDGALERLGRETLQSLLASGSDDRLMRAVFGHVAPGAHDLPASGRVELTTVASSLLRLEATADGVRVNGEARVVESLDVPPHRVYVVDRWFAASHGSVQPVKGN